MKNIIAVLIVLLWHETMAAQPRPYEIDESFMPTLEFMQKQWTGEYDGLEPNSQMILSIKRSLIINTDFTYINDVKGRVKQETDEILLRHEVGAYQYDPVSRTLTYSIEKDSTLDINVLLQGGDMSYAVNDYKKDGVLKTNKELAQFTYSINDNNRQWVLFDSQLMSPIDNRQNAVYVMEGKDFEVTKVYMLKDDGTKQRTSFFYDIAGKRVLNPTHGLYIKDGRKIFTQ